MNDPSRDLGAVTEARLSALFANSALATAAATAEFLGMDVTTLAALTDAHVIRAVRVGAGKTRRYAERDVRLYLTDSPPAERVDVKPVSVRPATRVVPFTQRRRNGH